MGIMPPTGASRRSILRSKPLFLTLLVLFCLVMVGSMLKDQWLSGFAPNSFVG